MLPIKKTTTVILAITQECNRKCSFCPVVRKKGWLDLNKVFEFINFIEKINPFFTYLHFQGGEPLLYWDKHQKIIEGFSKHKNIKFSLTTNGSLLNKRIIEFLLVNNVFLRLSIDSEKWDFNKDLPRIVSFLQIYNNTSALKLFGINIVLNSIMLEDIDWLVGVILENRITNFRIFPAFYTKWKDEDLLKLKFTLAKLAKKYNSALVGYTAVKNKPHINYLSNKSGVPLLGDYPTLDSSGDFFISDAVLFKKFMKLRKMLTLTNIYENNWQKQLLSLSFRDYFEKFAKINKFYTENIPYEIRIQNQQLRIIFQEYFERLLAVAN